MIKGTGRRVVALRSAAAAVAVAKFTILKKLRAGEELRLGLTPSSVDENAIDVGKMSLFYRGAHVVTVARSADGADSTSDKPRKLKKITKKKQRANARAFMSSTYRAAKSQELPNDFVMKFLSSSFLLRGLQAARQGR